MGMWGGGGGGGGMWGGGGRGGGAHAGLPFAGVPEELLAPVKQIESKEPEWGEQPLNFSQVMPTGEHYSLRVLLSGQVPAAVLALALVGVETLLLQAGPLLTKIGIDQGVVGRNTHVLVVACIAYIISLVVGGLATGLRTAWTARLAQRLNYEQRTRVFAHIQRLSLDFFTAEKAGRIMTRMTSDIEATNQMLQNGLVQMVVQALTIVVVTAVLFSMNVPLAAFVVLLVLPGMVLLSNWFRVASDRGYDRVRNGIAAVLADLQESLSGVRVVLANNRQQRNIDHHRDVVWVYRGANVLTAKLNAVYGPGSQAIGVVAQALVVAVGGVMVLHHQLTIGTLTAFVLYLTSFFAPIQQIAQLYNTYQQGTAAIAKLADLLSTQPTVPELPGAPDMPPMEGEIVLDGVDFGYDPSVPVLRNVDLRIAAGETLSLVGETGAGKSTIAKLVTRFYDPTRGRVLIDGWDLRQVNLASLRRQLGVVPQEAFLFSGTMRDNIAFARPEASDEEVMEACRVVGLTDLINRLPDGLDTPCHERGSSLSSGERQLLALA
ncbi:MAG: ABC transporter ATP-binding protein, partial [Chloroflexota bacterium]